MNLASALAGNFMDVVQYNLVGVSVDNNHCVAIMTCLQEDPYAVTIDELCNIMTNSSIGDELDRYAAVNSMFLEMDYEENLDVSYQGYIETMKNTSWSSLGGECMFC